MERLEELQNRRRKWKSSKRFSCPYCKYISNRLYNIDRHKLRIHSACAKPRQCCGMLLTTKGEYYMHCEENHPDTRLTNLTSRQKYKILPKMMIPKLLVNTESMTSSFVYHDVPYLLRSRVRSEILAMETKLEIASAVDYKLEGFVNDNKLEDTSLENRTSFHESSGYETKSSDNSTIDSEEASVAMKHKNDEERDATKDSGLFHLDDTSETVTEESSIHSSFEFSNNDQITLSGNSRPQESCDEMDVISPEQKTDVKHQEFDECSHINSMIGCYEENVETEPVFVPSENTQPLHIDIKSENSRSGILSTQDSSQLPPKKRILLNFFNRENTANAIKPVGDRLRIAKPQQVEEKSLRKKRLSKKRRSLQKRIALLRPPSSSSDQENIAPLTTNARKEKIPHSLRVYLKADGKSTWEQITVQMRERLQLIDFDNFK